VARWSIHSLIYLSFLMRLGLSLFTALAFRLAPNSALAQVLIDKNHPFVAFSYDLLGLLILLGILWAAAQRWLVRPPHRLTEGQDTFALILIGVLVLLGFLVEGSRILMTHIPPERAVFSFVGFPLSRLLSLMNLDWQAWYGALWWAHALAGAVFVASIPFGKMKHMLLTPLTLIINAKRK
jgi:nitrate reductase gamma subunit